MFITMTTGIGAYGLEESKCQPYLQKEQEGRPRKLLPGQTHLSPQEWLALETGLNGWVTSGNIPCGKLYLIPFPTWLFLYRGN